MSRKDGLRLTSVELKAMFADSHWADRFPPILSVEQAAELAHVPARTIYDWSFRGLLHGCSRRSGKRRRILRDRFVEFLFCDRES